MRRITFRIADLIVCGALFLLYEVVHLVARLFGKEDEYLV